MHPLKESRWMAGPKHWGHTTHKDPTYYARPRSRPPRPCCGCRSWREQNTGCLPSSTAGSTPTKRRTQRSQHKIDRASRPRPRRTQEHPRVFCIRRVGITTYTAGKNNEGRRLLYTGSGGRGEWRYQQTRPLPYTRDNKCPWNVKATKSLLLLPKLETTPK